MAPAITARWFVRSRPWAITPEAYGLMVEITAAHEIGIRRTKEEIEKRIDAAGGRRAYAPDDLEDDSPDHEDETPTGSNIAVIELRGLLVRHANWMTDYSGGTSTSAFAHCVRTAGADANIKGIALFGDTPGGTVDGMQEAAEAVAEVVASGKPVVGYAEHQLCSAGFGIFSQCSAIVAAKRAMVGSLGVIMEHEDVSGADKQAGYAYTYVTYPKGGNKAEGNPHEPLSPEAEKHYQDQIDPAGDAFYQLVADGRRVTVAKVNEWGKGRSYDSKNALALGLVDKVGTFADALALLDELSGGSPTEEDTMPELDKAATEAAVKLALPDALAAMKPGALDAHLKPLLDEQAKAITDANAAALKPLGDRMDALEAENKKLATDLDAANKASAKSLTLAALQGLADTGRLAPDLVAIELDDLMSMPADRREAKLDRMKAVKSTVPTKTSAIPATSADPVLATADTRAFTDPTGGGIDATEASVLAQLDFSDPVKAVAEYNRLRGEASDA